MQTLTAQKAETLAGQERLSNVHPGDVLGADFMEPLGLTAYRVAKDIGVRATRIGDLLLRRRAVTADTALRLSRYFGTTPQFWLNLQAAFDLEEAEESARGVYLGIAPICPATTPCPGQA